LGFQFSHALSDLPLIDPVKRIGSVGPNIDRPRLSEVELELHLQLIELAGNTYAQTLKMVKQK